LAPSRNANRQTELQRLEMVALRRPTGANCCMNSKMDLPRISWSPEGKFRDPTRHVAGVMDKWDVSTLAQIRERRIRTYEIGTQNKSSSVCVSTADEDDEPVRANRCGHMCNAIIRHC